MFFSLPLSLCLSVSNSVYLSLSIPVSVFLCLTFSLSMSFCLTPFLYQSLYYSLCFCLFGLSLFLFIILILILTSETFVKSAKLKTIYCKEKFSFFPVWSFMNFSVHQNTLNLRNHYFLSSSYVPKVNIDNEQRGAYSVIVNHSQRLKDVNCFRKKAPP